MNSPFEKYSKETLITYLDDFWASRPDFIPVVVETLEGIERGRLRVQAKKMLTRMTEINALIQQTKSHRKLVKLELEFLDLSDRHRKLTKRIYGDTYRSGK